MYNYVVTAHKPTAVTHSLTANFTGTTDVNLLICKCTQVEIYLLSQDGLQPMLAVPIYGRVSIMQTLRPEGENRDLLFICTERYKFCILAYDPEKGEVITRAQGDVKDLIGRPADVGQIGVIDPECRLIGLHLYDGLIKIIPIDKEGRLLGTEVYNLRLEELLIIDIKILSGTNKPTIVILYQDTKEARHVKTYEIDLIKKELKEGPWNLPNVEGGASMIITLPKPYGGTIIVGEQSIIYHNGQFFKSLAMKTTIMKAYGKIDASGKRILLGDHMGNIHVLVLTTEGNVVTGMTLETLGESSCPSTITYLDEGVVYIGSNYGDSQLIKLNDTKDEETGQYIEVIESFTNLGPIVDFCVVDIERQGQGQIVTCSGAYKDGSLRVVRNGIGINEHAAIDLQGVKGIWSLNPPIEGDKMEVDDEEGEMEKLLVMAFVGETRILAMAGEELSETEISGFVTEDETTLYCSSVPGGNYVQISEKSVYLVSSVTQERLDTWTPSSGQSATVCSAYGSQIVLATGGKQLYYLEIQNDKIVQKGNKQMDHEISCLNIRPVGGSDTATFCAVGLWTDITIRILGLPDLTEFNKEALGGEIVPRSVLFATFSGTHYLLVGLGDGHLLNFQFDLKQGHISDRKKISLGTQAIMLKPFVSKGEHNVFACSDRPTVLYSRNNKLLYSTVNLPEVSYMCDFDCQSFPESLALATENSLTIGTIDEIQKLHIRTVPLGEMPRRICHHESANVFCLLSVRLSINDEGEETETSFVKLIDDQTFEVVDSYQLQQFENACSCMTCEFTDDKNKYFVVGTALALPSEQEPTKGRLLVFNVVNNKLELQAETEVKGAVYCIEYFNGKLLAGINSKVQLFKWTEAEDGVMELVSECEKQGHIVVLFMATRGDFIVVGDLMKSISLLTYKSVDGTIEEIARDFNPNWMSSVAILEDEIFLGSENSFNLFSVQYVSGAPTEEKRTRLRVIGEYHLGEFVNRFRKGSLVMKLPDGESLELPTTLFATVNGQIGVVASLDKERFEFCTKLLSAINQNVKSIGGFSHDEWRSFCNERRTAPCKGFIDGDLVESVLDLPKNLVVKIAEQLGTTAEEVIKKVEAIQRAIH